MPEQELTLDQLIAMGAAPAPPPGMKKGELTLEELQALGAKPMPVETASGAATTGAAGRFISGFNPFAQPKINPGQEDIARMIETSPLPSGAVPFDRGGEIARFGQKMVADIYRQIPGRALSGDIAGTAGALTREGLMYALPKLLQSGATGKGIQEGLKESARKSYYQALNPTKKRFKFDARQVSQEAIDRGITGGIESIHEQARTITNAADTALDEAWAAIPEDRVMSVKPIINAMKEARKDFVVPKEQVVVNQSRMINPQTNRPFQTIQVQNVEKPIEPSVLDHIDKYIGLIRDMGPSVSPKSLRASRQVWDELVSRSGGYHGTDIATTTSNYGRQIASNAIREELSKEFPNIAKINKEFVFGKRLQDVAAATIERRTGQATPISENILAGGGVAGGIAHGGVTAGVLTGMALKYATKAFRSGAWKTTSAVMRDSIADALARGNGTAAALIFGHILNEAGLSVNEGASSK